MYLISQGQAIFQADPVLLSIRHFLEDQRPRTGRPKASQESGQQIDGPDDSPGIMAGLTDSGDTFLGIGPDGPVIKAAIAFGRTGCLEGIGPPFLTDQAGPGNEGSRFLSVRRPQGQAFPEHARPAQKQTQVPAGQAIAPQEAGQTGLYCSFPAHPVRVPLRFIIPVTLAESDASIPGPFRL